MTGLRIKLNNLIRERGYLSYDDMEAECKRLGYRTETGRRRLEPKESPCVKKIFKRGVRGEDYTAGYEYICGETKPTPEKVEPVKLIKLFEIRKSYWNI